MAVEDDRSGREQDPLAEVVELAEPWIAKALEHREVQVDGAAGPRTRISPPNMGAGPVAEALIDFG